ncbi:hypothetical protein AMATHDRAFT_140409 [Amanita thiersii Skay4041]|uniref:Palmitoyltransferase PFA4 n=1 Tax=Amanita thiersii Skay4041 TaxID=703135 RepID=A0A2A9NVF9_9AGAR|nr:hypothetical protein AMATHDRAFT_140409 [Amanita thiersii Skay4041]
MSSVLGWLVVAFVLSLISFIAYSSQIFIIWPWYHSTLSVDLIMLLLPFNILVGMLLWNYYLSVTIDPGRVPVNWKPDTHIDGYEVKKLTGKPRYCRMCERYKPPRAHHCRTCNRCVLRMDHHCPWINNCVGYHNHGHFIRFLFYVDLACSYHAAMISKRLYDSLQLHYADETSNLELIFIVLNYVACIPVLLLVGGFSLYHFYLLSGNCTTIEGWEKDKVATMIRKGKLQEVKFPYNLGVRRNIDTILGPNPLLWCWPTRVRGSGLKYEVSDGDDVEQSWPPQDPDKQQHEFSLPDTPWTYENGSINPNLQPSNSSERQHTMKRRRTKHPGVSSVPPYHPDYQATVDEDADSLVSSDDYSQPLLRRGSEGYEVHSIGREELLERYLRELGEDPGRYVRYIPQPDTDSESETDNIPLGQHAQAAPTMS